MKIQNNNVKNFKQGSRNGSGNEKRGLLKGKICGFRTKKVEWGSGRSGVGGSRGKEIKSFYEKFLF